MNLKCKRHPSEVYERICASSSCRYEPALCWQCMIDDAEHAKNHRVSIIKISEFTARIASEYENIIQHRIKDQNEAKQGHLQLVSEGQAYVDNYKYYINVRKLWCGNIIQSLLDFFADSCKKLQEDIFQSYDLKLQQFQDQFNLIKSTIEHRFGLKPLPTEEEINAQLEELAEKQENCNHYIAELKEKLLPPLDLEKNLKFLDALSDFENTNEMIQELEKECDKYLEDAQDSEEASKKFDFSKEETFVELLKYSKEIVNVLIDEIKLQVSSKDPILNRNIQINNLNESLHTINNIDINNNNEEERYSSAKRKTFPKRVAEGSPANDLEDYYNEYLPSTHTHVKNLVQTHTSQIIIHYIYIEAIPLNQPSSINFVKSVITMQTRGINCLQVLSSNCLATGSRDKSIAITYLNNQSSSYMLQGHQDQVTALAVFQDQMLISGGGNLDPTLIVWSLKTGKLVNKLVGHQSGITCIADLKDGQSIVSGSYDNHALIWNVTSGQAICALRKHSAMVSCLTVTQRKDHIITGSWDRTIGVWQLLYEGSRIVGCNYKYDLKSEGAVLCIKQMGDRQVLYSGTGNKLILLDWSTGEIKKKMNTSQFGVCEFVQSSRYILGVGLSDYSLRLWDLNDESEREIKKDQMNIQIQNYNASPKVMELEDGVVAIVNNSDQNPRVNIYEIKG